MQFISYAEELGYEDDVAHWTNELNKLNSESV